MLSAAKIATTITEFFMLLYWVLAGANAMGLIHIDPSYMYSDYENPRVVAWNWSFFPIDIALSVLGLWARFLTLPSDKNINWK